jgi:hypothetical protein
MQTLIALVIVTLVITFGMSTIAHVNVLDVIAAAMHLLGGK